MQTTLLILILIILILDYITKHYTLLKKVFKKTKKRLKGNKVEFKVLKKEYWEK